MSIAVKTKDFTVIPARAEVTWLELDGGFMPNLLITSHDHFVKGTLYAAWKKANPKESAALENYWITGIRPDNPHPGKEWTETGLGFLTFYDEYFLLKGN